MMVLQKEVVSTEMTVSCDVSAAGFLWESAWIEAFILLVQQKGYTVICFHSSTLLELLVQWQFGKDVCLWACKYGTTEAKSKCSEWDSNSRFYNSGAPQISRVWYSQGEDHTFMLVFARHLGVASWPLDHRCFYYKQLKFRRSIRVRDSEGFVFDSLMGREE